MNEDLKDPLMTNYRYELEAQAADDDAAEPARHAGEMDRYFDLSLHLQLPDTCWAMEKWDEARHWYRHNARILMEKRAWHAEHADPDYPTEELSDWEAVTFIKAGHLDEGREHVHRAVSYWQREPASNLVLTALALHAAQAGVPELSKHVSSIVEARLELPGEPDKEARRARELLHYEPAQVSLLLGQWDDLQKHLRQLGEAERLIQGKPEAAFPNPLQQALVSAFRGLTALASLHAGEIDRETGRQTARQAFEDALSNFYQFSGRPDYNVYFMRLNTRFADEMAAGLPINPNPFA